MNAMKKLLAVSILATAGVASATTIDTYTLTVVGNTTGAASGSLSGSGTATLDSSGVLTVDYNALNNQPSAGGNFNTHVHTVFNGTISGSSFTTTSGTSQITSCSPGTTTCPSALSTAQTTLTATGSGNGGLLEQAFAIGTTGSVGSNTSTTKAVGGLVTNKLTYTFTNTTVPVPAAAWLFGSGLLGLAGTARRRRSA